MFREDTDNAIGFFSRQCHLFFKVVPIYSQEYQQVPELSFCCFRKARPTVMDLTYLAHSPYLSKKGSEKVEFSWLLPLSFFLLFSIKYFHKTSKMAKNSFFFLPKTAYFRGRKKPNGTQDQGGIKWGNRGTRFLDSEGSHR